MSNNDNIFSGLPFPIVLAIGAVCLISILIVSNKEKKDWESFKKEHNCVKVGVTKGGVNYVITTRSDGLLIEGDKVSYKCDDGVTYTREE